MSEKLINAIDETISSLKGIKDNLKTGYYNETTPDPLYAKGKVSREIEEITGYLQEKTNEILAL